MPNDTKKKEIKRYASKKLNLKKEKPSYKSKSKESPFAKIREGAIYRFVIEVGYWHYSFEVERYLDDNDDEKVHIDCKLIEKKKVDKKQRITDSPMSIAPCVNDSLYFANDGRVRVIKKQAVADPILSCTYIPRVIDANDIWNELYEYISSLRDKEFEDSRSDEEHIESNGFDKKTSFRNIK